MKDKPHTEQVPYTSHPDATRGEQELDALASIYRRAIERYQEENAADAVTSSTDGDDTKEGSRDDFRATDIIQG